MIRQAGREMSQYGGACRGAWIATRGAEAIVPGQWVESENDHGEDGMDDIVRGPY